MKKKSQKILIKKNLKRHLFTFIKFKKKLFKEFQNDYDKNLLLKSIFFAAHFWYFVK